MVMNPFDEAEKNIAAAETSTAAIDAVSDNAFVVAKGGKKTPFDIAVAEQNKIRSLEEEYKKGQDDDGFPSVSARRMAAEITGVSPEEEALEAPMVDPIDAITGPLGFVNKVGAKIALKVIPGSLLAEPVIGQTQEYVMGKTEKFPAAARVPINILTGLVVGDVLTTASRNAKQLKSMRPASWSKKESSALKAGALKDMALGGTTTTKIPQADIQKSVTHQGLQAVGNIWTKYIGSPVWDKMVMEKIPLLLEKVPGGKSVNRALIYGYRGDLPESKLFMGLKEDMDKKVGIGADYAINLGKRLQSFKQKDQLALGEYIRGERIQLPKHLQEIGDEAKDSLYRLGKEAVSLGLLDEKAFFRNAGKYMPRLYSSKEYGDKLIQFGVKKPTRLDLSRFKKRKDIPKEIREQMGEILTPGFPVAKGIAQLTNDINMAKFFNSISKNNQWVAAGGQNIPAGFKQLPKTKKLGSLSEAHVHPEIYEELNDVAKTLSLGSKAWLKALGSWKFGKVVLSPKTHMRNVLSNSVLAHTGGFPLTSQPAYLKRAAVELQRGGDYWSIAKESGLLDSSFIKKEMGQLFGSIDSKIGGVKSGSLQDAVGELGKITSAISSAGRKASDLYQAEEQLFKMAKLMHNIEKRGMDAATASADAEKWLFNYGKLTRAQDMYRKSPLGAPFATFTIKALPRMAEAAIKHPWRFVAPWLAMSGLQELASDKIGDTKEQREGKSELKPEWMQGSVGPFPNFPRVPIVDDDGREYYLNLTYILPWGDIGEGGEFMGIPGSLRPLSQPGVSELAQQIGNYDFFWKSDIVKDVDVAGKSGIDKAKTEATIRGKHAWNHFAPTLAMDVEKVLSASRGEPDYRGRIRPGGVVAADVVAGIKMYPVDYAENVARLVNIKNPNGGVVANKIKNQIQTLYTKKKAALENNKEKLATSYQKEIDEKIKQIEGLATETGQIAESYRKVRGE